MLGRRQYRFLSPSSLFNPETRQIVKLKGAGLAHTPNLHLTALANAVAPMPPATPEADLMPRILAAPGLPPPKHCQTSFQPRLNRPFNSPSTLTTPWPNTAATAPAEPGPRVTAFPNCAP